MADYNNYAPSLSSFGTKGGAITPADDTDLSPLPKAILVTAAGALQVLPVNNANDAWVDCGTCEVGFVPPFRVRRVKETSAATVVGIWD